MKFKLVICLLGSLLIEIFAQRAFAQDQTTIQSIRNIFSVSPIIIDTSLQKGEKKQIHLNIGNRLEVPLGIKVTVENFYPSDGETVVSNQFKNSPLVDWITFSKDTFIIDAKKDQNINMYIDTPQNLPDGGYYAVVFFTPFYSNPANSSPTVLTKVGALILASAGKINYENLKEKVSIPQMKFSLFNQSGMPLKYSFAVENSYFTHFSAKPFLEVSPLFGQKQRIVLSDKRILPGTQRAWIETLDSKNLSLINQVRLAVSVGQGNYIFKNSLFFVLPIKEISVIILLILIFLIVKFRGNQIRKAIKILLRG